MNPPITIRPMTPADLPIVSRWMADVPLWQRYGLTAAQAEANLARGLRDSDMLLIADAASPATDTPTGQACGMIWCVPHGAFGRSPYVRLLGVRDDHAGQGIGAALLREAEQRVMPASSDMFLLVSDFNSGAQQFYQRAGYHQIGAIPGYVLPDVTELLYWKRLVIVCSL